MHTIQHANAVDLCTFFIFYFVFFLMMMMAHCTFCTRKYTHTLISRVLCIVQFATRAILTAFHSLHVSVSVCYMRVCVCVCAVHVTCAVHCRVFAGALAFCNIITSFLQCNVHAFHDQKLV